MSEAVTALKELSKEESLKIAEIQEEIAFKDELAKSSAAEYSRKEGKKEGKEEGKEEGKAEVAINLLKKGFDDTEIAEATNLSREKILSLKKSLRNKS